MHVSGDRYVFGWEPVAVLLAEPNIRELILEQWEELAANKTVPLDPDFERMRALERLGLYRAWAARRDGLLIGLIEFTVTPPLHHRGTTYAFDGGHFLHPEARSPFLWLRMWRAALDALRGLGVRVVMAHDNPRRPLDRAFARLGFTPGGRLYWREL